VDLCSFYGFHCGCSSPPWGLLRRLDAIEKTKLQQSRRAKGEVPGGEKAEENLQEGRNEDVKEQVKKFRGRTPKVQSSR